MKIQKDFFVAVMCCLLFLIALKVAPVFVDEPFSFPLKSVKIFTNALIVLSIFLIYKYFNFTGYLMEKWNRWNIFLNSFLIIISVYIVVNANSSSSESIGYYLEYVASKMSVGVVEEVLFRGVIFIFIFKYFGLQKGIFYTALIFSFFHSLNYFSGRISLNDVIIQMIYAFGTGAFFAAFYLRFKSLFTIALLHGYLNLFLGGAEKGTDISESITIGSIILFSIITGILILISKLLIYKRTNYSYNEFLSDFSE